MKAACPVCSRALNASKRVAGPEGAPEAGDLTICVYCFAPLVFQSEGYREASHDEARKHAGLYAAARAEVARRMFCAWSGGSA